MCSIILSIDTEEAREVASQSKVRGTHSYSIYYVNKENLETAFYKKSLGELDVNRIRIPENHLAIIHQQAPTTSARDLDAVHPSTIFKNNHFDMLWHNGIIKQHDIKRLQKKMDDNKIKIHTNSQYEWDTHLMHQNILIDNDYNFDGSFACVNYRSGEYINIFRNDIAPLYMNNNTISSIQTKDSYLLPSNQIWQLNRPVKGGLLLYAIDSFKTIENPFYFGE